MINSIKSWVEDPKNKYKILAGAGLVFFIIILASNSEKKRVLTPKEQAMSKINVFEALVKVERKIKDNLRNPSSYNRRGYNVWIIDTMERKVGVYIEYEAQNGFGGTNREKAIANVDSNGTVEVNQ